MKDIPEITEVKKIIIQTDAGDMVIIPLNPKETSIEISNSSEEMRDYKNHVPTKTIWSQIKFKLNGDVEEVMFVND